MAVVVWRISRGMRTGSQGTCMWLPPMADPGSLLEKLPTSTLAFFFTPFLFWWIFLVFRILGSGDLGEQVVIIGRGYDHALCLSGSPQSPFC